jgi:hypothetical protein
VPCGDEVGQGGEIQENSGIPYSSHLIVLMDVFDRLWQKYEHCLVIKLFMELSFLLGLKMARQLCGNNVFHW